MITPLSTDSALQLMMSQPNACTWWQDKALASEHAYYMRASHRSAGHYHLLEQTGHH